jgi:hypothetical protein
MNTKIIHIDNFKQIKDNFNDIRLYLYSFIPEDKRHISMVIDIRDTVISIKLKNNPKTYEISWIVINGSGGNTAVHNYYPSDGSSRFKEKGKTYPIDVENIRRETKDIDFEKVLKSINRNKLINELL